MLHYSIKKIILEYVLNISEMWLFPFLTIGENVWNNTFTIAYITKYYVYLFRVDETVAGTCKGGGVFTLLNQISVKCTAIMQILNHDLALSQFALLINWICIKTCLSMSFESYFKFLRILISIMKLVKFK